MNPIVFALRHPITMMTAIVAVIAGAVLAVLRMPIDIFPDLNTPIIYVAQPYGGMDPQQMEGFLTNYYEYHFLYITGIEHIESKSIQGNALIKLQFHPGTNMAQAMAETVSYVNRARAFMPPGTRAAVCRQVRCGQRAGRQSRLCERYAHCRRDSGCRAQSRPPSLRDTAGSV